MTLAAVLFDLDDTLHDKTTTLLRVGTQQYVEAELAALGIARESWLRHYVALNNQRIEKSEVFSRLASTFRLPPQLAERLLRDFDTNLGRFAVPFPGATELIAWCQSIGLKVGIVTNGRDAFQRSKIEGMGLSGAVDATVTSGGYGVKKPDHAIFLACLQRLRTSAKEAAFVGDDMLADMEPAIALGMLPIWKSGAKSERVAFSSDHLSEIHAYLRGVA